MNWCRGQVLVRYEFRRRRVCSGVRPAGQGRSGSMFVVERAKTSVLMETKSLYKDEGLSRCELVVVVRWLWRCQEGGSEVTTGQTRRPADQALLVPSSIRASGVWQGRQKRGGDAGGWFLGLRCGTTVDLRTLQQQSRSTALETDLTGAALRCSRCGIEWRRLAGRYSLMAV